MQGDLLEVLPAQNKLLGAERVAAQKLEKRLQAVVRNKNRQLEKTKEKMFDQYIGHLEKLDALQEEELDSTSPRLGGGCTTNVEANDLFWISLVVIKQLFLLLLSLNQALTCFFWIILSCGWKINSAVSEFELRQLHLRNKTKAVRSMEGTMRNQVDKARRELKQAKKELRLHHQQTLATETFLRRKRLQDGPELVLYHQTGKEAVAAIRETNRMKCGTRGWAGGGIYFATNERDTKAKARTKGYMVIAKVRLGNVKVISATGDRNITFTSLILDNFDSVLIPRPNGDEYVVYCYDQVEILRIKKMAVAD